MENVIGSARQFWEKIANPDYLDFKDKPTDLRTAFHAAVSLFQQRDWVFEQYHEETPNRIFGHANLYGFAGELADRCPDFRLLGDVANAHKHFRLGGSARRRRTPSARRRRTPLVTSSTQITVDAPTWGKSHWGEFSADGARPILIEISPTEERHFWSVAENVHGMWVDLFRNEGW